MTLGIVPNGIKIEWNHTQNGIPVVNRVFVTLTEEPETADLENAAFVALGHWENYKGFCHPSLILQDITVTDVSIADGPQIITPLTSDNVGTGAGGPAAANAAMCASLRTGRTGKSFRGRYYLGGLAQFLLSDAQNISTTYTGQFATVMSDFIDALAVVGLKLVVVSNYANTLIRVVALATEIIAIIVDSKVDSQRRRTAN